MAESTEAVSATGKTIVKIYVTLGGAGDQEARDIGFRIPAGIDSIELLDLGFAIDGNEAVTTIVWNREGAYFEGPFGARNASSFNGALTEAQRGLVRYLREKGFEPRFV